eukprot:6212270-Pleurochrysis_carterae.AAC.3
MAGRQQPLLLPQPPFTSDCTARLAQTLCKRSMKQHQDTTQALDEAARWANREICLACCCVFAASTVAARTVAFFCLARSRN